MESFGFGVSLFLMAAGAILALAVTVEVEGLDIQVVGWILLAVGGFGLLLSLLAWSSWLEWGSRDRREVVERREDPYETRRIR